MRSLEAQDMRGDNQQRSGELQKARDKSFGPSRKRKENYHLENRTDQGGGSMERTWVGGLAGFGAPASRSDAYG